MENSAALIFSLFIAINTSVGESAMSHLTLFPLALRPLCLLRAMTVCLLSLLKDNAVLFQMGNNPLSQFFVQSLAIVRRKGIRMICSVAVLFSAQYVSIALSNEVVYF